MYVGDFALGETFDVKFCTVSTAGVPTTLAGTPVVSAYPGNSTTELTAGITLTVDFDARTGMHNVRVVATSGNGYATATNYALVITTGTVGGSSVVGYVIGHFSIENRSALRPTVAARTLDVSATGEAGVDWANVGSPTTTVGLSGTTVKTATDVETDTQDIQARLPAALTAGGNIKADVLAISGDTVAADNLEAALDGTGGVTITAAVTGNITGNLSGSVGSVTGAVGSVTGAVGSVTGAVGSVAAAVTVGTNNDKTGYALTAAYDPAKTAAQAGDAMALTAGERTSTADALLGRNIAGGSSTGRTVTSALRRIRNRVAIAAGTMTVYQEDDSTTDHTATVTTAAGDPISAIDPA